MTARRSSNRLILSCGLAVGLIPLTTYHLNSQLGLHPHHGFMIGYGLAALPFIGVWTNHRRFENTQAALIWLLLVAALSRCLLLSVPPVLSEDLWRYIWDGMVQWSGESQYGFAPSATALDAFAAEYNLSDLRARIGHSDVPTIYPPTGQATFLIATAMGPSQVAMRSTMIIADLVIIATLWAWGRHRAVGPSGALLYAFLPLTVIESSVGGHIDAVGAAFLVLGLYLFECGRPLRGALSVALSIGTKLVPVMMLVHFIRRQRRFALWLLMGTGVMLGASLLMYDSYPRGLVTFAHQWRGNDSLFAIVFNTIQESLGDPSQRIYVPEWFAQIASLLVGHQSDIGQSALSGAEMALVCAKLVSAAVLGTVTLVAGMRARTSSGFWFAFMGCLLLVSPVVHPWYLVWVLPFAILHLNKDHRWFGVAFILWATTAWVVYWPRPHYLETGIWIESTSLKVVEYIPVWACIFWAAIQTLRRASTKLGTQ